MPITSSFQPMLTQTSDVTNSLAVSLLTHYSFDLGGYSASELVKRWENQYPSNWVHLAITEALYQGRYKAVSVQQILTLWLRRNHPGYHFNMEFERLICNKLPEDLRWNSLPPLRPALPSVSNHRTIKDVMKTYQSSRTLNTSYQTNNQQAIETPSENNNYHTAELAIQTEENSTPRNATKALSAASSMVFTTSNQASTAQGTISRTLIETKHIENSESTLEESEPEKPLSNLAKLLPPARNHPPIEQFTPQKSDSTETFTSKLKAIVKE
ncbi:MAG: hypothetical protein WBA41_03810 [Rivularia sp. (in: cyanobacteria)]